MKPLKDEIKSDALKRVSAALTNTSRSKRDSMFQRYMDEPYGDEVEGQSQHRSTDVADTVEAIFAEGMEVLAGNDFLVEFSPVGPEDLDAAKQETTIIHHYFREKNNAFVNLSTWFKSGLIEQNAYIRAGWVDRDKVMIEEYEGLTIDEFMTIYAKIAREDVDYEVEHLEGIELDDDDVPILESYNPEGIDVRVRCVKRVKLYEIEPIPQNEIAIAPQWNKVSLDGCPAYAHEGRKSKAELRAIGISEESIKKLSQSENDTSDTIRHHTENSDDTTDDTTDNRLAVAEAYVLVDLDDDGGDRLLRMWTTADGGEILKLKKGGDAVEEVESGPFVPWTPYIVPHRHIGKSSAELAANIQKLKTVLWRHTLDNLYNTNYQRPVVIEDLATETTYEDLLSTEAGAPIRVQGVGAVTWEKPASILGDTLPLMDRADQDLEKHAGATRYAQGLDPNSLAKSQIGSEGVGRIMDAAMKRIQVIIRTFAETGLRELFLKMHADMRRGPVRELAEMINDEWVETNPLKWRDRTDMKVRIGTGRGDREAMLSGLRYILAEQKEAILAQAPHVSLQHVYETQKQIIRALGFPSIDPFMSDPAKLPPAPQEQPPEPTATELAQIELAKAEAVKAQAAMVRAQTDQAKAGAELQHKSRELALEREIAEFKAQEAVAMLDAKRVELEIKKQDAAIREAKAINEIEGDAEDRNKETLQGAQL